MSDVRLLDALGYTFFNDDDDEACSLDIYVEGPTEAHERIAGSLETGDGMTVRAALAEPPLVLVTGHMPALDTCGGHVAPGSVTGSKKEWQSLWARAPRAGRPT